MPLNKDFTEATTVPAKYIFLDVVGFTDGRSVEAQADIVETMNLAVRAVIKENSIGPDQRLFLPTGDGMCIALLNIESPYDIHLRLALGIIRLIAEHNLSSEDEMRRFQVRIGVNANTDNLITDINGNLNMAGAGISLAARIMTVADGSQVIVGESVFETFRYREKYMDSFKLYTARVKHKVDLRVYQFIGEGHAGLNVDPPRAFRTLDQVEPTLTVTAAYFFAHALKHHQFFLTKLGIIQASAGLILLWLLARNSEAHANDSEIDKREGRPYLDALNIEEQFELCMKLDISILIEFGKCVEKHLVSYSKFFKTATRYNEYRFLTLEGIRKLKREWPDIWVELGLDERLLDG